MYQNIDKSAFRKGQYVGYALGLVWRVYKDANGRWHGTTKGRIIFGDTLRDISEQLSAMKPADTLANPFVAA